MVGTQKPVLYIGILRTRLCQQLPSVVKVLPAVPKGRYLSQSCDLNSAAGYVLHYFLLFAK